MTGVESNLDIVFRYAGRKLFCQFLTNYPKIANKMNDNKMSLHIPHFKLLSMESFDKSAMSTE